MFTFSASEVKARGGCRYGSECPNTCPCPGGLPGAILEIIVAILVTTLVQLQLQGLRVDVLRGVTIVAVMEVTAQETV